MTWWKVFFGAVVGKFENVNYLLNQYIFSLLILNYAFLLLFYWYRDGQVGTLVLRNMKPLVSPELYQTLLKGESNYDLPKSWSINVVETRESAAL